MEMTTKTRQAQAAQGRVYSYIRFSTPEQRLGDSERRQLDAVEAFARRQGLKLDESLRMADRGVSGFRGAHRKRGALGEFLAEAKAGNVPRGSVLVVENIDRLGRESVIDALTNVVFAIFECGISIHTLSPSQTYNRSTVNEYAIYELIGEIKRANRESQRKSELVSAAWARKRREARKRI